MMIWASKEHHAIKAEYNLDLLAEGFTVRLQRQQKVIL